MKEDPWYKDPINVIIVHSILLLLNLAIVLSGLIKHNFSISWRDDDFLTLFIAPPIWIISSITWIVQARARMKN